MVGVMRPAVMALAAVLLVVGCPKKAEDEWSRAFGGVGLDYACSAEQTSDGGYIIAGRTDSYDAVLDDILLIETDADGEKVWEKTFGDEGLDWAESVLQISDGGYSAAGVTTSYGAGGYDVWLVKTPEP